MNYPVWDVAFGAGLLMAAISILHVFVSHFAVGGGLFLVLTEKKAYREKDMALLGWLRRHTRFFVLVTVVFGAVSGVGIWFTIGLINPSATSSLIHSYVWGWAIEWVFFFLEITAALLYMYGWDKMDRRLHLWYGWIYFIAAFASMVIINGIVSFMLTSGQWLETHDFWSGFFNPSFFPSLCFRFALSLALAGIYALLTASLSKDAELKGRLTKWSAVWIIPAFIVLPFLAWWYITVVPPELWASARGLMPTATRYASIITILAAITFILSLLTLVKPRKLPFTLSLLITLSALATMGAFEFIREAVRKPYVIAGYMYGNSLFVTPGPGDGGFTVENIDQAGVLNTAKWTENRNPTDETRLDSGKEIFLVECQSCHTRDKYRGLKQYLNLRRWDKSTTEQMLGSLDLMHNGVMPPFTGHRSELNALAAFLMNIHSRPTEADVSLDGLTVFNRYCAPCHQVESRDALFTRLQTMEPVSADKALQDLKAMFIRMPGVRLNQQERTALIQWIREQAFAGR
jgi:mono/diheme cytochrome c family protein